MSDVKVQAVVEASTEGVERAFDRVGDKAVQMASKVDQAAQKAGGSVDSIGKGAGGSADQLTRAEGKMVASIKRVQTQMELAGKTASQKFEFNIAAKGLDAAKFEPYLQQLRKMEAAALSTSAVSTSAFSSMGSAVTAFVVAAGAAVLGAAYAFDSLVKKAGDFQDMAEKVGGSAEGLASMAVAAATAGAQMDTVAGAMNRMTKGLVGVDDTSKNAGAAISALGLQLGSFKELAPEDQMEAVAKALAGFEDGASKSAVAMALFGKSGAELMPFLKELVAEGGRQQILTQAQITLADEYADKQARLTAEIGLYAQSIAIQALPAMNDLFGAFADTLKGVAGVNDEVTGLAENNGVAEFAGGAVKALAFVMDSVDGVSRAFQIVGKSIAGATAIATSPYTQSGAIWDAMSEDINQVVQRTTVLGALQERTAKRAVESISTVREELKKLNFSGVVKPITAINNGSAKNDITQQYAAALAAEKDFAASQIKIINARVSAGIESEEDGIKKVLAAKVAGFDKEREILNAQLAKTADKGEKTKIEQQIAAIGTASTVAAAEADAAFAKIGQARDKYLQAQVTSANSIAYRIEDENAALREQIDVLGMSEQQIGEYEAAKINAAAGAEYLAAANLREAASSMEAAGVASEAIPYYRQLAEAREAAGNALSEKAALESTKGIKKSAIEVEKAWDKTSDKIGDSISDALMRGFESGKGFAETLGDTVVNMFKTMVLQPTIKAVVVGGVSAVGMGGAMAADGTSSAGMGNMLSTGNSIFQTGSMLAGGYGALPLTETIANGVGMMGGDSLGSLIGMNAHWTAGAGAAAAADLGATIGTAAGTALAGSAAGTVFATTATGAAVSTTTAAGVAAASGTAAAGAGTAAMAAVPVAGWIAAAAVAAYEIFGHKKTQDTGASVTSTNGGMGANVLIGRGTSADTYDAGIATGVAMINKSYFDTLNPLLAALGNKQVFSITSDQSAKKEGNGNQYAGFDIGVDGQKSTLQYGYGKVSDAEALAKATSSALGEGISRAISMSDLSAPIKKLFEGVVDQAVVGTMVTGLTKVGNASKELNDVWGISVSQAAEVAMLTGQTQEGIAKTVDAIGTFAAAQRTVGATLETAFASLDPVFTALTNSALPDSLAAYDAAMKNVDTTVAGGIETFAALFAMREGFAQMQAAIDALKTSASTSIDAFRTPEERLTLRQATLSDLSTKAGIAVPTSGAELVAMFDSIDFTKPTQAGMNLASALPAIAAAFTEVQNAEKALASGATAAATAMEELRTTLLEHFSTAQTLDQAMQSVSSGLGLSIDSLKNMSADDLTASMAEMITSADSAKLEIINGLIPALDMIAETAKEKATAIASERQGLQDELDSLTLTSTQLLAKQAAALDATNRPLFNQINAIKALAAASAEAAERMNSAAATFKNAFATDTSKAADLKSSLASLGYKMPKSEAEFIKSVNDLQKTAYSKDHAIAAALTSVSAGYAKDLAAGSADIDKALASGVKSALAGTGITLPKTIDELDALIANISVDGNGPTAKKLADLQNLSPAVVEYFNYLEQHAADVKTASTAAADAIKDAIASARDSLRSISYLGLDQTEVAKREAARLTKSFNDAFTVDAPSTLEAAKKMAAALDPTVAADRALIPSLLELAQALNTVEEATKAAEKAIADQRDGLQSQLWQSQGNTVALRAKELALIDASNRELQQQIWAIEDQKTSLEKIKTNANDAYSALERAVTAQKKSAQASIDTAQEQVSTLKSIFDNLKSNINTLYGQVDSTKAMGASDGQAFIANALSNAQSSGYMPDPTELSDAVSAAMAGTTDGIYASQVDADRAKLVLAGQMSQLKDVAGMQMTSAEQALKVAQDQLKALDSTLEEQKKLLDAANGIDVSVLSVADAIANLSTAIRELTGAKAKAAMGAYSTKDYNYASYGGKEYQESKGIVAGIGIEAEIASMVGSSNPALSLAKATSGSGVSSALFNDVLAAQGIKDSSQIAGYGDYLLSQGKVDEEWLHKAGFVGYARGANVIPNDQIAQVHKGEAIIPAAFNPWLNGGKAANDDGVIAELKAVKAELVEARKQRDITNARLARIEKATNGNPDQPLLVEVAA